MITTMFTVLWLLSLVLLGAQILRFLLIASLWASGSLVDILPAGRRDASSEPTAGDRIHRRRHAISSATGTRRRRAIADTSSLRRHA
jgi:hypothetical protein